MRKICLLVMLAGIAVSSCSKEENTVLADNHKVTIKARLSEEAAPTKTVLNADGKVEWKAGESVKIFNNNNSGRFVSTNSTPLQAVDFEGSLVIEEGTKVYGLYPYSESASCNSDGVFTTSLPSEQTAVAGTFDNNLLITIGQSEDLSMVFYNVCSGIRFKLAQAGVRSVKLETLGGEYIAGTFNVSFGADGKPVLGSITAGSSSITLSAPAGTAFETDTWYYFVTLPVTIEDGITFTIATEDATGTRTRSSELQLQRAQFKQAATLDKNVPMYKNGNIVFADELVEELCVIEWDTDGDGELSYKEAALVTTIGSLFTYIPEITSFDELQYFTGITEIGAEAFWGCSNMTSVKLPESITIIGAGAFSDCAGLSTITIPGSVTEIGIYAFFNCMGITVTMEGTTPPGVDQEGVDMTFPESITIRVPNTALGTYQAAWAIGIANGWNVVGY